MSIEREEPVPVYLQTDLFMPVQSVQESVALLLNAGVYGIKGEIYGLARNFLDPECTALYFALYRIKESGKDLPLLITAPPKGHIKEEFRGFTDEKDLMHKRSMFDYLELDTYEVIGNIAQTKMPLFDIELFKQQVKEILTVLDAPNTDPNEVRHILIKNMCVFALDVYSHCDTERLAQVIIWGLNPQLIKEGAIDIGYHKDIISILFKAFIMKESLEGLFPYRISILQQSLNLAKKYFEYSPTENKEHGCLR